MARQVFDIFLSSTSKDLKAHRAKVAEMVDRLRQTSIRMETFGARPKQPLDVCRAEVAKCDALIVIVGHRYGWVPGEQEGGDGSTSITWWEVKWALDAGKPVFAFLVAPDTLWPGEREQDRLTTATTDAEFIEIGRHVRQLHAFRDFLGKNTTLEPFSSAEDLGGKVATSMHEWLLNQSMAAMRSALPAEERQPVAPPPAPTQPRKSIESSIALEQLYWQEQIHLLSAHRASSGGAEVRIALVAGRADTTHPALARAAVRQFDVRHEPESEAPDEFTTAVAALLVGNDEANAYVGIAPQAQLTILQVLDDNYTVTNADVVIAIDAAIREGAHIVCVPLGSPNPSEIEADSYRRAAELGIIVIGPAGNDADHKPVYPAGYPECIAAASIDGRNELAYFSNFGDWVTTGAPGVDLPVAAGREGYQRMSGTAFSCAIVSGVAALMRSVNPGLNLPLTAEILRSVGTPVLPGETARAVGKLRILDAAQALVLSREAARSKAKRGTRKSKSKPERGKSGPGVKRASTRLQKPKGQGR